jgi:phosphatidylserine decarboxylase
MKITPYGHATLAKAITLCLLVVSVRFIPNVPIAVSFIAVLLAILTTLFAVQFFRDPERTPPNEENIVVSPADGKVVLIQDVENERFGGKAKLVSIFMSPFNVHVNRNPISGKVISLRYVEGQYIAAFDHQAVSYTHLRAHET